MIATQGSHPWSMVGEGIPGAPQPTMTFLPLITQGLGCNHLTNNLQSFLGFQVHNLGGKININISQKEYKKLIEYYIVL